MFAPILAKKAGMTVHLNFVKTEINAHQVKDFIDYFHDKVDGIHISHALNFEDTHNNYYDQSNEPVGICEGYANMIYVLPSGTVVPCCPAVTHYDDSNKYSLPYANINEHSAEEILFMMREFLKNEKFRNMCAHCTQYARRGYIPFKRQIYGYDALQTSLSLFITKDTVKKKNIFKRWKRSVLN
jgi:hypothetical protein